MFDPYWRDRAACLGKDPVIWDMPQGDNNNGTASRKKAKKVAFAKAICQSCPVIAECRIEAFENDNHMMMKLYSHGEGDRLIDSTIRAGKTPGERRKEDKRHVRSN